VILDQIGTTITARTTKQITNTQAKSAKPRDKVYTLADGGGLQLRVKPNGTKLWLLDYYRPHTKKRTSISFGSYPDLSIADARKKRDSAKSLLANEIDPQEHRESQRQDHANAHTNTLEHVASHWLELKKSSVSLDHANDTWRSLELHIFPSIGKVPIHKVTAIKTISVMKPLTSKGIE
jgi:hypothetical protein